MKANYAALFIKPEVTLEQLTTFGFKEENGIIVWRPSNTAEESEKKYYELDTEYYIYLNQRQLIIVPKTWLQISAKIQCLLYDLVKADLVEKREVLNVNVNN